MGRQACFNLVLVVLIILLLFNVVSTVPRVSAEPTVRYLDLQISGGEPMGIVYDNKTNKVYVAIYSYIISNNKIVVINISDLSYQVYNSPTILWKLVLDGDGNVWTSVQGHSVTKFIASNCTFKIVYTPFVPTNAITFYKDYIWIITANYTMLQPYFFLLQVNYTTCEIVKIWKIPDVRVGDEITDAFCDLYGSDDKLWSTTFETSSTKYKGAIVIFDVINETFLEPVKGLYKPLGLYGDSKYIYVAESGTEVYTTCIMSKINKQTLEVTKIDTGVPKRLSKPEHEGMYYVFVDSYNNVWWTSCADYFGCITLSGVGTMLSYRSVAEHNFFMTEVKTQVGGKVKEEIWFSARGSTIVGMVDIVNKYSFEDLDINSDGIIDYADISPVCKLFGKTRTDPKWNERYDITKDGIIDYKDINPLCRNFGKQW